MPVIGLLTRWLVYLKQKWKLSGSLKFTSLPRRERILDLWEPAGRSQLNLDVAGSCPVLTVRPWSFLLNTNIFTED